VNTAPSAGSSLLEVRELCARPGGRGLFERGRTLEFELAGISFELGAGELLALLGESGSGKSSLLRALLGLEPVASGSVTLRLPTGAIDLLALGARERRRALARIGWIPQDPGAALDPRASVLESVAEMLLAHCRERAGPARARAQACLEACGISRAQAARLPHQLSGGERQRAVLARALVLEPAVLLLDEPTSSLDASIAAHLVDTVVELVRARRLGALWVTHDVELARCCSDRVLVLDAGRIVERGDTAQLLAAPRSPAAQRLLRAADWGGAQSLTP